MDQLDLALDTAERKKAAEDPVRQEQAKLAPVRVWAQKQEQEFLAGVASLAPRIDKALATFNRLTALLGAPPSESLRRWEELDRLRTGIPQTYRGIVHQIDTLTPYLVEQPYYMLPLYNKSKCPPGTIRNLEQVLERLERSLAERIEAIEEQGVQKPALMTVADRPERRGPKVDSDFQV